MIDAIKNKKPNELKKALKDAQKIGGFFPFVLEYNRAMLGSCSENAILFTNGDDDTFPAWYLQEIENVRKDVTIVNLSLLNSPFYIKYLRDFKGLDFNLSNEDIDLLKARSWPRPREEFISLYNEDKNGFFIDTMRLTIYESYLDSEGSGLLSISDQLSLLLIKKYLGYKDIYFSESTWYDASIPYSVFNYTVSEGLVNKLIPQPSDRIYSYEKWEENLFKNYTYSNFTDPRIFGSNTLYGPISSYRASFNELAQIYKYRSNKEKVREILDFKDTVIPYNNIPIPWDNLLDIYRNSQVPNLYDFSGLENPNFNMLDSLSQEYIMELKTTAIDSPYYYMDITTHYMEEGDWDNSYQYLKEYLKYKPTDKIRQQASMIIEFGLGNYQEGFKIGNELLNEDSDNISIIDLLAFKSMEKKQYDIAATYFDRLLVINDYDYNTYNSYGLLHLYQKQYDLAINKFKKVLDYAPTYKDNYKYALSNIAETYIAMGENEKAITLYKELIEIDPTMSLAYSKLAILYYQENNKPITDELIQIATDNMFAGSYGQLGLACYYSYINNLEQSYYYLETAIKMGFSDIGWIEYDPHLDNIKGTKRFENLINSIVRN